MNALILILVLLLGGCVSATVPMVKEDMSSFDRDNYECYRERREGGFGVNINISPPTTSTRSSAAGVGDALGHRIRQSREERENYVLCMRARGYHTE